MSFPERYTEHLNEGTFSSMEKMFQSDLLIRICWLIMIGCTCKPSRIR